MVLPRCFPGGFRAERGTAKAMTDLRVTRRVVDRLIPRATEFTVWDSKLPGFGVRVRPTGAKSFVVV